MAAVSRLTLRTRIREELGIEQTDEVMTDVELNARINWAAAKLYNRLVKADEDYFLTSTTFTLAPGVNTYTMPTLYKVRGLEYALSAADNRWRDVVPHSFGYRNHQWGRSFRVVGGTTLRVMPQSMSGGDYQLWYIPAFTDMASDVATTETINGWERLIVVEVVAWGLTKQNLDGAQAYMIEAKQLEEDIDTYARGRLAVGPRVVKDVRPRFGHASNVSTEHDDL